MNDMECLFGRWVRVPGDEPGDVERYQRAGGAPRTRDPRSVVEFDPAGTVTRHLPGPADARTAYPGRWGIARLALTWADGSPETLVEVISCNGELLELRVLSGALGRSDL